MWSIKASKNLLYINSIRLLAITWDLTDVKFCLFPPSVDRYYVTAPEIRAGVGGGAGIRQTQTLFHVPDK